MLHFTKRKKTIYGLLNFYFNEINTVEGMRFYISTIGPDRKVIAFNMEQNNGKWQLQNPSNCPEWILDLEDRLSKTIIEAKGNNE